MHKKNMEAFNILFAKMTDEYIWDRNINEDI